MKTWEMIKELTENPEKIFRNQNGERISVLSGNELYFDDGYKNIYLCDEWEEVKEPVDFMEALKSCKRVSVEHPNLFDMPVIYKKNASIATVINYIFESYSDALVREIILNGKWYIEED